MIAKITQTEKGYLAHMERHMNHNCENIWAMLTDNTQLAKWFDELRAGELYDGGYMKFYVKDVMDEKLVITEFKTLSVLAFDWFGDEVRFELQPELGGCVLVFSEKINKLTKQTKKDIAGWHVCLDVIQALLDGETIQREEEWKKWYEEYAQVINELG